MFIYILNLLNDGKKRKKNDYEILATDILNDTKYIYELGGIRKNIDLNIIGDRLNNIVELFYKYNLSLKESKVTFDKLLNNRRNIWILEHFYNFGVNKIIDSSNLGLRYIISDILQKSKIGNDDININCLAV